MVKNLFLFVLFTWVGQTYAKSTIVQHSMTDAESYKVEKSKPEQEATRAVAGSKIKKKKEVVQDDRPSKVEEEETSGSDSEVRYWQYSE